MNPLAALTRAYGRMAARREVPGFGYSDVTIGFVILLDETGAPSGLPVDRREGVGKKLTAPVLSVPQPIKRASNIAPNFLWDKTAYALGVTAGEGKRVAAEHAAFVALHRAALADSDDPGLRALLHFLDDWRPERFEALGWPEAMKDQNVVFALTSEYRQGNLHDRPAAQDAWARLLKAAERSAAVCLVSGEPGPIARLHPAIKGVWGAQSSGASLVSFNLDAFTSYGHEQGDNAPVSEATAFAYTTALNKLLERGSRNRLQIGDASTVFWADAAEASLTAEAEASFRAFFDEQPIDESIEAGRVGAILEQIRAGRPIADCSPDLAEGVRFHVLGLSPNAARLSVRFWLDDDFGEIARRFARHTDYMRIEPPPKDAHPSIWRCLIETAVLGKSDNIIPNLAGDWLRAILTGRPYPRTLLTTILMRLRADQDVTALRVAMLKAVLQSRHQEVPVALDPANIDPGYLLGRLFATYEYIQVQALGGAVNATIRDQFYGTASATPRAVFPILQRKATHHLSKLRKEKPGLATNLDRKLGEIFDLAGPTGLLTPTLTAQRQALFTVGYYHQKNEFYRRKDSAQAAAEETPQ